MSLGPLLDITTVYVVVVLAVYVVTPSSFVICKSTGTDAEVGVDVGGTGVDVGGTGVDVGRTGVDVGFGLRVEVGGNGV